LLYQGGGFHSSIGAKRDDFKAMPSSLPVSKQIAITKVLSLSLSLSLSLTLSLSLSLSLSLPLVFGLWSLAAGLWSLVFRWSLVLKFVFALPLSLTHMSCLALVYLVL
jgi:hypothetical protein